MVLAPGSDKIRWLLAAASLAALAGCTPPAPEENTVYEFDPYAGDPAYPNRRPVIELPTGPVGLVSNNGSDSVSLLDFEGEKVLATSPVGRDPVDNDGPHHIAGDRAAGLVYVALAYPPPTASVGPHAAHASHRTGFVQKLALGDMRPLGEVRVDASPGDIVLSDDKKRLVVSHFDLLKAAKPGPLDSRRSTIAVLHPDDILASGSPDPTRIPVCLAPHGVALSRPDGAVAYVACYGEDVIAVVDLNDPSAPIVRVPITSGGPSEEGPPVNGPYAAIMSPSGSTLAISDTESKDVRFFDTASNAMAGEVIKTEGAPFFTAWSADEMELFVPTQTPDTLIVVDPKTGDVKRTRMFDAATCEKPHSVTLGEGGETVYLVCEGDHAKPSSVLALSASSLETKITYPVGVYPDHLFILEAP